MWPVGDGADARAGMWMGWMVQVEGWQGPQAIRTGVDVHWEVTQMVTGS